MEITIKRYSRKMTYEDAATLEEFWELVCQQETLDEILAVLALCTKAQQERFLLYTLYDYSYAEIGRLCSCSKAAVHESIEGVRKKFFKFYR